MLAGEYKMLYPLAQNYSRVGVGSSKAQALMYYTGHTCSETKHAQQRDFSRFSIRTAVSSQFLMHNS